MFKVSELTTQVLEGLLANCGHDAESVRILRGELRSRGVMVAAAESPEKKPGAGSRFAGLSGGSRPRGEMNKTETLYAKHLQEQKLAGELVDWRYELVKLRLTDAIEGQRCVWFTSDFISIDNEQHCYIDDVKGNGPDNDASILRAKICPVVWPHWTYRIVRRVSGQWEYRVL